MASVAASFAVRSSTGISVLKGSGEFEPVNGFVPDTSKSCRAITFSEDGKLFAWVNGQAIRVVETESWNVVAELQHPKASNIVFSPQGNYFACWEPFVVTKAAPQGSSNLHVYKTSDWQVVKAVVHKRQGDWEPQWSADEVVCARLVNGEVQFHEAGDLDRYARKTRGIGKVAAFSLAPVASDSLYVLCHTPGSSGQPALARLLKHPQLEPVATKTFMQADRVEFRWNSRGNSALIITSTDVDKTGASYYGRQSLHYMSSRGDTAIVAFAKDGPLQSTAWSPSGAEFCAIYGFMPASAAIYNLKCEVVADLGEGSYNQVHYNSQGNALLLAGFGNLRGHIEVWDALAKSKVGECSAPDSTQLLWNPDGEHFITATTAPRLRTGNGWRLWHCSGELLQERSWPESQELFELCWKPHPGLPAPQLRRAAAVKGIRSSQPLPSKEVYRPPNARVSFAPTSQPSKQAVKNKKNREAKKAAAPVERLPGIEIALTGDAERDKKIKGLKRKLDAITQLKQQLNGGKSLEVNQLAKIDTEADLLRQLHELQV